MDSPRLKEYKQEMARCFPVPLNMDPSLIGMPRA